MEQKKRISQRNLGLLIAVLVIIGCGFGYLKSKGILAKEVFTRTGKDYSGVIFRERIYSSSAGMTRKFMMLDDGLVLDEFAHRQNLDKKADDKNQILQNKLMVAEKGDTVCYLIWSDGKVEITDVRFAVK